MTKPANRTAENKLLSPVDALAQLSFLVQARLEQRAAEHELSMIQTRLLGILRDRTPTMNELARLLGLDKSSVTGLVDRAERRGLVARAASAADRRAVHVSLTKEGNATVQGVSSLFEADMTALLSHLPASDRKALSGLASRVVLAHAASEGVDLSATKPVSPGRRPRRS